MLKRLKISQYVAVPNGCLYRSSIRGRQSRRTDVKITQQTGTCTGIVKDATGEGVIGAVCSSERDYEWYYHRA